MSGIPLPNQRTLAHYLTKFAGHGGYIACTQDPPAGNIIMWRGITCLTDIQFGAMVGAKRMGN